MATSSHQCFPVETNEIRTIPDYTKLVDSLEVEPEKTNRVAILSKTVLNLNKLE